VWVIDKLRAWWRGRQTQEQRDAATVRALRASGVRIGERCRIYSRDFSTEPFLVSIGDDTCIAGGVTFLTHDGAARLLAARRPGLQKLGRITVGNGCFIGQNAIILPGTSIGSGSVVGAGAVVIGLVPENSLVVGNPARVVGRASLYLERLIRHPDAIDSYGLPEAERREMILRHFAERDRSAPAGAGGD
jgi:acetyltransferase-like isoleucine patch superfamily enzyme